MRNIPIIVVIGIALALGFSAGWLLSSPANVTAAPVYRWTAADEAYYTDLLDAHTALRSAFGAVFDTLGTGVDDDALETVHLVAQAIADLEPTTPLLAVDSIALYAASYCASTADFLNSAAEDEAGLMFAIAPALAARDHCARALADVKVELARFAAANGGFPAPDEPAGAATPAPTATKRP